MFFHHLFRILNYILSFFKRKEELKKDPYYHYRNNHYYNPSCLNDLRESPTFLDHIHSEKFNCLKCTNLNKENARLKEDNQALMARIDEAESKLTEKKLEEESDEIFWNSLQKELNANPIKLCTPEIEPVIKPKKSKKKKKKK